MTTAAAPWRRLLPVYLSCLGYGVQAGAAMPLVPLALEHRGIDNVTIGLVEAVWGIGMIATAHRIPAVAARLGAVKLVCASLVLSAALAVTFAYTESLPLWFVLSFLLGMVGGVPWVVSEIWINLVVDESRRGRAVGIYAALMAGGMAMGPLALQVVGVYGPRPFLACAAFALLVALPLLPSWNNAPPIRPGATPGAGGQTVAGVWRPGIYFQDEARQGLMNTDQERHAALQATRLLLDRLDELLLYIEPSASSLVTYGHKTRELLILACTEVENSWKHYMRVARNIPSNGRDHTTRDYVKLLRALHLSEFELSIKPYAIPPIRPFAAWDLARPSQSLRWYEAYNLTKHDRQTHFDKATLECAIDAVCAHLVMFSVRFSPFPLAEEGGSAAALFQQLFEISLRDCSPTEFYVPLLELPQNLRSEAIWFNSVQSKYVRPRDVQHFQL